MNKKMKNLFANARQIAAQGIICMLLFAMVSCESSKEPYTLDETKEVEEEVVGATFTEFSLSGTSCEWIRIELPNLFSSPFTMASRLIVVNSDEELRNHIICTGEYELPVIDFSKHTLLLVRAVTSTGISSVCVDLQQTSTQQYVLNVDLRVNDATVIGDWQTAIIVSKLEGNDNVKLNVTYGF